jgi:ABC-type bacteriocin/lantibiotic exporters, contain an N-terminal double-glycine peptidase domain
MGIKNMWELVTPNKLLDFMSNNIEYGYVDRYNNKHINDLEDIYKNYILQSPQQLFESKVGVCWDQTCFEAFVFENYIKYPFSLFYVEQRNQMCNTHTFLVYKRMNKYYYFENSYEKYRGIHEVKDEATAIKMVVDNMRKDYSDNGIQIRKIKQIPFGYDCMKFMNYCVDDGVNLDKIIDDKYTHSDKFSDVIDVFNSLSDVDKKQFTPDGTFNDTNKCIYIKVYKINNDNAGFIYIDSFKEYKSEAFIGIAVSPKYRGKGLSKTMVDGAINTLSNDKNIQSLVWIASIDNDVSNKLAVKLGFNKTVSNNGFNEYSYSLHNKLDESVTGMNISDFKKKYPNGFYGKDLNNPDNTRGIWNSAKWVGNKFYRERVEVLILNDNNDIFLAPANKYYSYTLPGGSIEPDIGIIETAIKETEEEARLIIKDVKFMNQYTDDRKHTWDIILNDDENVKLQYNGNINYVCVAKYDSRYHGAVNISDVDEKTASGRFKPMKEVYGDLSDIHKKAIDGYLNSKLNESYNYDKDDIYINFDKWRDSKSGVLLITGLSGSGKSTLAKQLSDQYKSDLIKLDDLDEDVDNSKTNFLSKFKEEYPKYNDYFNNGWKDSKYNTEEVVKSFIEFCIEYAETNNIKVIIEGIVIFFTMAETDDDCEYMKDKSIIIKSSGVIESTIRQLNRYIHGGHKGTGVIELIKHKKYLNEFKNRIMSESALTTKDRNNLEDKDFGIPQERKYPLIDKSHVIQAIRYFNKCDPKYEKELAGNIIRKAEEFKIDVKVSPSSRLWRYLRTR